MEARGVSSQWTGVVVLGLDALGWSVRLNACGRIRWVQSRSDICRIVMNDEGLLNAHE